MADERFVRQELAAANFVVTVGKPAARKPDPEVRVITNDLANPQFRIDVGRRNRQPQRLVCAEKIRLVMKIKHVKCQRRMSFQRAVVPELNQIARNRIYLTRCQKRAEAARHQHKKYPSPKTMHAHLLAKTPPTGKWFDYPGGVRCRVSGVRYQVSGGRRPVRP